ncbi:MAG: cation diffusion facilitator family transporter [Candidatus Krumholzibacteriia bacterium]
MRIDDAPGTAATRGSGSPERSRLVRRAVHLEMFTVGYNILEGVVATSLGWLAGSIALVGFGIDSAIETLSALVVLRHMQLAARSTTPADHEHEEKRAQRIVGATLFALCAYVAYESTLTLATREAPSESPIGIALAALSLVVMPFLAWAKRRTGHALDSRALVADAAETIVCAYLSFTLLMGLALNATLGWWWADPIAALVMVPFIFREAREAWEGEG